MSDPNASPSTPPGWYPDQTGQQRWWDGQQWGPTATEAQQPMAAPGTPQASSASLDTSMPMLAHVLGLIAGFLGPLIIYLVTDQQNRFVRHHAAEALNFQLTLLIAWVASFVLMFVLVGFLLIPVILIVDIVLCIMAAMAANRGEWYRYPINIRMVSP